MSGEELWLSAYTCKAVTGFTSCLRETRETAETARRKIPSTRTNHAPIIYKSASIAAKACRIRTSSETYTAQQKTTMSNTVHVKGISSQTSEKEVRDFFSFWYVKQVFNLRTCTSLTRLQRQDPVHLRDARVQRRRLDAIRHGDIREGDGG